MAREFRLPDLGEGLTEAEVVSVLVAEGDLIREDQPIFVVETEKAQVELPSPFEGRVARIHVRPGQRVSVGAVLITLVEAGPEAAAVEAPAAVGAGRAAGVAAAHVSPGPPAGRTVPGAPASAEPAAGRGLPPAATPATRRLARELGVDLATVVGTGPGGRITDEDVRAAARRGAPGPPRRPEAAPAPAPAPPAGLAAAAPAPVEPGEPGGLRLPVAGLEEPPLPRFEQWGPVEREPLRGVRRRSAEHLALAWLLIPHVTHFDQADVTELEALRRRQQGLGEAWGGELTLTVLLVKAVAVVLQRHPRLNASLDVRAGEVVLKRYYHIGVAVDTDRGLVVPVLRDVDRKRIGEVAAELAALVQRTREGRVTVEELRGGTFTVTNTGALGGRGATPIIHWPEVAILGVGRAHEAAVVRDGQVTVRLVLPLALSFDHRVVDGMEAARFMTDLVRLLEAPERLLLLA